MLSDMARKQYPNGNKLRKMFIETASAYHKFEVIQEGTVSHIKVDDDEYFVFFKCVTPEGNPHPIEHQRAQLPQRPEFNEVVKTNIPFLFLGYDMENDVFVTWEPDKLRARLNKKSYVSFYSRLSIQESVYEGEIKEETLSNGDKFVLFKRTDIIPFFQMIDEHFPELSKVKTEEVSESEGSLKSKKKGDIVGKLSSISEDENVKQCVDEMIQENASNLEIVFACMNNFSVTYNKMQLVDWNKVIKEYKSENSITEE